MVWPLRSRRCVGLWGGAFLPLIQVLPIVFPLMMVGGAALGMLGVPVPPVEIGIALSVLVLGGCIALAIQAPVWAAAVIVAAFAVFHGYAHGKELPSAGDPIGYSAMPSRGTWLLNVIWTKALPSSRETDFETVFASLSFGFP